MLGDPQARPAAVPLKVAFALAAPIVWRAQHEGSHEQDRWDAMAWLELFRPTGYVRCQCTKCETLWAKAELGRTGTLVGRALAAAREGDNEANPAPTKSRDGGWYAPGTARKYHFFDGGRSLCGGWSHLGGRFLTSPDPAITCKACARKLS